MGQAADTYIQRHPYAYTSFEMAPGPIDYTNLDGGTHVRIFSHTFLKKQLIQKFFGSFPRDLGARRPHLPIPLLAPPMQGFFTPLQLKINKMFYSGTPNLQLRLYDNTAFGSPSRRYVP